MFLSKINNLRAFCIFRLLCQVGFNLLMLFYVDDHEISPIIVMIINIKSWYSYDNQLNITNYITKYIIVILPQCLLPIIDFPSRNRRKPLFRSHPPTSRSVVTVQLICLQKSPAQTRSPWNSPSVCKLSTSTVVFRGYVFRMNEGWVHFIVLRCRSGMMITFLWGW